MAPAGQLWPPVPVHAKQGPDPLVALLLAKLRRKLAANVLRYREAQGLTVEAAATSATDE